MFTRSARLILAGVVLALCVWGVTTASAATTAAITANPGPPQALRNDGAGVLTYTYTLSWDSTPDSYVISIINPSGVTVSSSSFPMSGGPGSLSDSGTYTVPGGAPTGRWRVRIQYFNTLFLEAEAAQDFLVDSATGAATLVKFNDLDGDGVRDDGEPGIAGWSITLTRAAGGVSTDPITRTYTTGTDGSVTVSGLAMGTYTIAEESRAGWVATSASSVVRTLSTNGQTESVLFANAQLGQICGTVFTDANRNGVLEAGETPIAGVVVAGSGPTAAEATSDTGGDYCLRELRPGDYTVHVPTPPSGLDATTVQSRAVALRSGGSVTDQDFGYAPPAPVTPEALGRICGVVYRDANENGVRDPQESIRYRNVTIALDGTRAGATKTNADGRYCFADLPAGPYRIRMTPPAKTRSTGDADGKANGTTTIALTLPAGGERLNEDFGLAPPAPVLTITKTASVARVRAGGVVTWTVTVRNTGPSVARGVVLRDPVSLFATIARKGGGRLSGGTLVFGLGDMAPGARRTVRFAWRIDRTAGSRTMVNRAEVGATNAAPKKDSASVKVIRVAPPRREVPVTG